MQSRWVRQLIHRELDLAREAWLGSATDVPVDLDIEFEEQHVSMTAESEQEAAKLLAKVTADGTRDSMHQGEDWPSGDAYWDAREDVVGTDCHDAIDAWAVEPDLERQKAFELERPRADPGTASTDKPLVDPQSSATESVTRTRSRFGSQVPSRRSSRTRRPIRTTTS